MHRRTLIAGLSALAAAPTLPGAAAWAQGASGQAGRAKVVFWHAMNGALGEVLGHMCTEFNQSQSEAEIVPIFKGTYPETLTAAIAAWRAGEAPTIVQMFEVGTGSMLAAGPAVKQTWQLAKETGVSIDPEKYVAAVRGYYSLPDGRLASVPFNSSTPVMWLNAAAFEKAGLDPHKTLATWPEVIEAAQAIKAKGAAKIVSTSAWFSWVQLETYGAMHNLPFATEENGFKGLDAKLLVNAPDFVKQMDRFLTMSKEGLFKYTGRDSTPDAVFVSGDAAITFGSSGLRSTIAKSASFPWVEAMLPYDPEVIKSPLNSVIGGASLWTMTAPKRTPAEYKGAAMFLSWLSDPKQDAFWHQSTGYVPVTKAGYELSKSEGFYQKNPGADVPIEELARGHVTPNSKGFRLGRMSEIRNIIYEETEKALQGQQNGKQALDNVVARGDRVLREFERANKA